LRLRRRSLAAPLAIVAAAIALACATGRVPDHGARETGRLFFWKVENPTEAGGNAHLLGSVHFGRPDFRLDPAIQEAFEGSDALVMELDPEDVTAEKMSALLEEMGRLPEGETLSDVISPETYQALADALQRNSYSIAGLDPFKPWVAILSLSSLAAQSGGLTREEGVEAQLIERAGASMDTIGLETPEEQMAIFDNMPRELQEEILRGLVSEGDALLDATDAIVEAWLRGDTERLAEIALIGSDDDEGARVFHETMYLARNQNMARAIAGLIDRGGEWFVVIGAAHMVGDESIPTLLAERGYLVRQIEKTVGRSHEADRP
jgi:uncharacterized protein YbaP (TraB family)